MEQAKKNAERKARDNNGAKRNVHFEMETVERDIYPENIEGGTVFGTGDTIRYRMIL